MTKKPNILVLMTDQHRYDCIGYSKDYPVKTPNLDKLAAQGMSFSNAFTPIPLCCPARQAFISCKRPESMGLLWNYPLLGMKGMDRDEYSWVRELKKYGYSTDYIGKWHVSPDNDPTCYGYNSFIDESNYRKFRKENFPQWGKRPNDFIESFYGCIDEIPLEGSRTHWAANEAIKKIDSYAKEGKPWHLVLSLSEPHLPCEPSKEFANMYDVDDIPKWRSFDDSFENKPYIQKQQLLNWKNENYTWDDWKATVAYYYAIISQVDDAFGKVINRIDDLGLSEDTIIVYTTDHGDMCGAHKMMDKHYVMYDDVVHVPLIIRWPHIAQANTICKDFVYNFLDLQPTFLDILGIEGKDFFAGKSILSIMKGQTPSDWRKEVISTYNGQQFGLYVQRMIRNENFKYIWNPTDTDELYDLRNDPNELMNQINNNEYKNSLIYLRNRLYDELSEMKDTMVEYDWTKLQLTMGRKL